MAKVAGLLVVNEMAKPLSLRQLGYVCLWGVVVAVHAARKFWLMIHYSKAGFKYSTLLVETECWRQYVIWST